MEKKTVGEPRMTMLENALMAYGIPVFPIRAMFIEKRMKSSYRVVSPFLIRSLAIKYNVYFEVEPVIAHE